MHKDYQTHVHVQVSITNYSKQKTLTFCTQPFYQPRGKMDPSQGKTKTKKRKKVCIMAKKQAMKPLYINLWDFDEVIPLLEEDMCLTKSKVGELECRSNYSIRCLTNIDFNKNDLLYKIYGEQIDKSPSFMRNCTRLYTLSNKKQLKRLAENYLESTNTKMASWMKDIKEGRKGNLLTLYILSLVTGTHCCIHLKGQKCWMTLKEKPNTHAELMQRCNIHLAYMGQNNFIQLTLRTTKVSYKLFGIDNPLEIMEPFSAVTGALTSDEHSTLDMIMEEAPHPIVEPTNSGIPDLQPQHVMLVTAEVHASFNDSPHRTQGTKEKPHNSKEYMIKDDKKEGDELNVTLQDIKGDGLVNVPTLPGDTTTKKQDMEKWITC